MVLLIVLVSKQLKNLAVMVKIMKNILAGYLTE